MTLVFGAIDVFSQLRAALNAIWNVEDADRGGVLTGLLRAKLLSFGMILVIGFLLLVSLVVSTLLSALDGYIVGAFPAAEVALNLLSFAISLGLITLLFALVYRYLPNAVITWRVAWVGALVTALLFTIGEALLSLYLANSSAASIYGAAGSFVLILLWIYYSAQIDLFGAEFTQVYTRQFGSRIRSEPASAQVTDRHSANRA